MGICHNRPSRGSFDLASLSPSCASAAPFACMSTICHLRWLVCPSPLSWLRTHKCAFSVGWRKRVYLSYCMFLTVFFKDGAFEPGLLGLVVGRLGLVVGLLPVVGLLIGGARWHHDAHHNVANHAGECSKEDREEHVAQSHECGVDFKIFSHAAEHTAEGFVGRGFVKFFSSVSHFFIVLVC